jgi:phosphomethylpyrimidine synthase
MMDFSIVEAEDAQQVCISEKIEMDYLKREFEKGTIVIPKNKNHKKVKATGIGKGLRTKINVNLGTSPDLVDYELELSKLNLAINLGADTVMDLSTGGDLAFLRHKIIEISTLPVGTVPIYETICDLTKKGKNLEEMTKQHLFSNIEAHLESGVDFITVHCGLTRRALLFIEKKTRIAGIVSRGGSFLYRWMKKNQKENPLYEYYDELLALAKKYNVTLSLGDGLRPGSIVDATDSMQMDELLILGELVDRARDYGVQAMVEGPGHIPLNEVEANVLLEKKIAKEAPFYVLGPLVTDCAPGYDDIVSAIGGAIAAASGADFLCYVTPAEHLSLPGLEDVRRGIVASKIAAHAGDIVKGVKGAIELDKEISRARKNFDWDKMISLSPDPQFAQTKRGRIPNDSRKCTMCGQFCAMRENL